MRLPLACKVMAEVTVEFSAYFGVSDFSEAKFLFEAVEQVAPRVLRFRHCACAPAAVGDTQKVIDSRNLHKDMNEKRSKIQHTGIN